MRLLNRFTRVALLCLATLVALILGMASAQASSYWDSVAQGMGDSHVWQDANVQVLTASQVNTLKSQVNQLGKPIFIVVVDQSKAGDATADYPTKLQNATGKSGVMVVVGTKSFRAQGFQTSQQVADQAPVVATAVVKDAKARGKKGPDYETVVNFVNDMSGLNWTTKVSSSNSSAQNASGTSTSSTAWIWYLVLGLFLLCALGIVLTIILRNRSSRNDDEADYTDRRPRYVSRPTDAAMNDHTGYADSEDDFGLPHDDPNAYVPLREPARTGLRGQNDYEAHHSTTRTTVNNHYYGGNSVYPSGYYSDSFWNAYLMSSLINNNGGGSYNQGYRDGERQDNSGSSSSPTPDNSSNADDTGTYDSGSSGGGDWADTSSNSSGSDDSSSSSGGGGFDSGGGGSDSGSSGGGDF